jgi:Methyltransferase domain
MFHRLRRLQRWIRAIPNLRLRDHIEAMSSGAQPIYLEYKVNLEQRWTAPAGHPLLQSLLSDSREASIRILLQLEDFIDNFRTIPEKKPPGPLGPFWTNGYVEGMDALMLYGIPSIYKSRIYTEIGSGNSTLFVRKSIVDKRLSTKLVSIDPLPRAEIDAVCDEIIRKPLEDIDPDIFQQLCENDLLMIDNSHRCFQNSDVTVAFLDILPRLRSGVLVYIDDIYLPYDYPKEWFGRYYSEQYLLAAMLLADGGRRYEVLYASQFAAQDEVLGPVLEEFWSKLGIPAAAKPGNGFWMRIR